LSEEIDALFEEAQPEQPTLQAPPEGQPYEVKAGKVINEGKGQKVLHNLKKEIKKAMQ
jgi:hypothetical protein